MKGSISNVIAGCFSLAAFAVAVIAGLAGDNAASAVLIRAIIAMLLGYPVGLLAGMICARAIDAGVEDGRQQRIDSPAADQAGEHDQARDSTARAAEQVLTV